MTEFHSRDNNIQSGQRLFPFQPAHSAFAGNVSRIGRLEHQSFVSPQRRFNE